VIGAVGVDAQGNKNVLGIQEGATANAAETKDLPKAWWSAASIRGLWAGTDSSFLIAIRYEPVRLKPQLFAWSFSNDQEGYDLRGMI